MNKIIKDLFNIESTRFNQMFNFITVFFLAMIFKLFIIMKIEGNTFISSFEISVWAFMIVWIVLRIFHSFNQLEGFYSLASAPICLSMLFPKDTMGLTASVVIFGVGYFIHLYSDYYKLFSSPKTNKTSGAEE